MKLKENKKLLKYFFNPIFLILLLVILGFSKIFFLKTVTQDLNVDHHEAMNHGAHGVVNIQQGDENFECMGFVSKHNTLTTNSHCLSPFFNSTNINIFFLSDNKKYPLELAIDIEKEVRSIFDLKKDVVDLNIVGGENLNPAKYYSNFNYESDSLDLYYSNRSNVFVKCGFRYNPDHEILLSSDCYPPKGFSGSPLYAIDGNDYKVVAIYHGFIEGESKILGIATKYSK